MATVSPPASSALVVDSARQKNVSPQQAPVSKAALLTTKPASTGRVDTSQDRATSMEEIADAVATLQQAVDTYTPAMNIGFDGELNRVVVRVMDSETNELIRELPTEEVLKIARFLERYGAEAIGTESLKGMLLDDYG